MSSRINPHELYTKARSAARALPASTTADELNPLFDVLDYLIRSSGSNKSRLENCTILNSLRSTDQAKIHRSEIILGTREEFDYELFDTVALTVAENFGISVDEVIYGEANIDAKKTFIYLLREFYGFKGNELSRILILHPASICRYHNGLKHEDTNSIIKKRANLIKEEVDKRLQTFKR